MALTQEQKEKLQQLFQAAANGVYVIRRNVVVEGRRCAIVFVAPAKPGGYIRGVRIPAQPEKVVGGITEEKYAQDREEIERMWSEATEQARKREIELSWITLALAGRILASAGTSWETGLSYWELNAHVPDDVWREIRGYFDKVEQGGDLEHPVSGWVIIGHENAEKVREKLRVLAQKFATPEHHRSAQELIAASQQAREREQAVQQKKKEMKKIVAEIKQIFHEHGEKPSGSYVVDGEVIDNPFCRRNIYGGGEWWVIQKDYIWYVMNNGGDGDDWSLNNVVTGGAGAIGIRIPYDEHVAQMIRELR